MIANSFLARFNAWLLKSEYTIVTSLQPNKFKDIIFKIIANISSTLLWKLRNYASLFGFKYNQLRQDVM
jgi:hypothetical protein